VRVPGPGLGRRSRHRAIRPLVDDGWVAVRACRGTRVLIFSRIYREHCSENRNRGAVSTWAITQEHRERRFGATLAHEPPAPGRLAADLTTKFQSGHKNPEVEAAPSLERLGVDYVDPYSGLASNPDQD
jgi:hypothetical protein